MVDSLASESVIGKKRHKHLKSELDFETVTDEKSQAESESEGEFVAGALCSAFNWILA